MSDSKPLFRVGDTGEIQGLHWRIRQGVKDEGDMVVEVCSPTWTRTKMAVPLLLADFHYQVEDILYAARQGGEYFLYAVAEACQRRGWRFVAARIERERQGGGIPTRGRYRPLAPYEGREDEGRRIGNLRTRIMALIWLRAVSVDELADGLRKVVADIEQGAV